MRTLRIVVLGTGALVAVVLAAAIGAAIVVDGAFVKTRLERAMKEKHRTLTIEGEPKLSLFPVF